MYSKLFLIDSRFDFLMLLIDGATKSLTKAKTSINIVIVKSLSNSEFIGNGMNKDNNDDCGNDLLRKYKTWKNICWKI